VQLVNPDFRASHK